MTFRCALTQMLEFGPHMRETRFPSRMVLGNLEGEEKFGKVTDMSCKISNLSN